MITGSHLIDELWHGARARRQTINEFVRPLTSDPGKYLKQLRLAKAPKPETIDRIRKLIAGEPVPPPPPNNFQKWNRYQAEGGCSPSEYHAAAASRVAMHSDAQEELERRRAIAEAAALERRPGETLHDAVRRIEAQLDEQMKEAA